MRRVLLNQAGFTLIELLTVILIIGILTAIAVPVFIDVTYNTKVKTCRTNLRTLDDAVQTYASVNKRQPQKLSDLVPEFIKKVPSEPFSGDYTLVAADSASPTHAECSKNHNY